MDEVIIVDLIFSISTTIGGYGNIAHKWQKQLSHGSTVGIRLHRCD